MKSIYAPNPTARIKTEYFPDSNGEVATPYKPSTIKSKRATKKEIIDRRRAFLSIIFEQKPMTVRQVFYLASVRDLVPKDESGYRRVQTDLVAMRKSGDLPYEWLADNTRWQRKPSTFSNPAEALKETARFYRKALPRQLC